MLTTPSQKDSGGDHCFISEAYLARLRTDAGPTDARARGGPFLRCNGTELPAEQLDLMIVALRALYGSDPECLTAEPRDIRGVSVLADKYDMVARFRPMAAIGLGCLGATSTQPDRQAAWDLPVAAYLF
ncbi:hypothetical protein F52700_11342 [Fusarium sp. NRRL 52700]|nr:hypothetical protein F52700_11342 [Fusarium sp. NRRL 52700]